MMSRFDSRLLALVVVAVFGGFPMSSASAASNSQIDASLEKAKAYLYGLQKDGTWEEQNKPPSDESVLKDQQSISGGQWTGQTALAVYALLSAGEKHTDERLAKAIAFLKQNKTVGVYALGLRMQVWLHLPPTPDVIAVAKRDADVLLRSVKSEGSALGMYGYVLGSKPTLYSHSRSQYGVLGIWAADQMGVAIPGKYWETVETAWVKHQASDGGWTYQAPKETEYPTTPGMTAVGVATLFITQDYTRAAEGLAGKGNLSNPSIDRGLKWMGDHMNLVATNESYPRDYPYATLYAVERIGVAAGLKYLGKSDWFSKGSDWLVKGQSKSGSWSGGRSASLSDTCFAVLFLSRGRAPIAFAKLDYSRGQIGPTAPAWNQRPRDLANLTRWAGKQVEQQLTWQVVPTAAPLKDMIESPILVIDGAKPLTIDDNEKKRLREYVEAGGLIVGNADGASAGFSTSFKKLGNELFKSYEFRELPANHPMYTAVFQRAKWRVKPSVLGLSNGVRELMLLLPTADLSRQWQSKVVVGKEDLWQLGAAMMLYASRGQDLRYRGESHLIERDPDVKTTRPLPLYRLDHPQNSDPEPGGWRRIANLLANNYKLDLAVQTIKLGEGNLPAGGLAHLTGTGKFAFTAAQRQAIKAYVDGGGLMLIDAAGGDAAFATSAEAELVGIFGATQLAQLPADHPLYKLNDKSIDIRYRLAAQKTVAGQSRTPRLKAVQVNGRVGLLFSREDLSAGWVGNSVDGIIGYDPKTATDLVTSICLYAAGISGEAKQPAASTAPVTTAPARPAETPAKGGAPEVGF